VPAQAKDIAYLRRSNLSELVLLGKVLSGSQELTFGGMSVDSARRVTKLMMADERNNRTCAVV
jgi:hypothetical protein